MVAKIKLEIVDYIKSNGKESRFKQFILTTLDKTTFYNARNKNDTIARFGDTILYMCDKTYVCDTFYTLSIEKQVLHFVFDVLNFRSLYSKMGDAYTALTDERILGVGLLNKIDKEKERYKLPRVYYHKLNKWCECIANSIDDFNGYYKIILQDTEIQMCVLVVKELSDTDVLVERETDHIYYIEIKNNSVLKFLDVEVAEFKDRNKVVISLMA